MVRWQEVWALMPPNDKAGAIVVLVVAFLSAARVLWLIGSMM